MIVIPCHYDAAFPLVQKAVASARMQMPNEAVCVVDCASRDTSYIPAVESFGATVVRHGNYFETGALWRAYDEFPDEDFFYLLHDSCEILKDMTQIQDWPVGCFMFHPGWRDAKAKHMIWATQALALSDYGMMLSGFSMVFGSMLFISRKLLDRLRLKNFHRIVPVDKVGSCAMERLWGMALAQEGWPVLPCLTEWQWTDPEPLVTTFVKKTWCHRGGR